MSEPLDPPGAVPASQRWSLVAIAACLLVVVGVGVWSYLSSPHPAFQRGLAKLRAGNDDRSAIAEFDRVLESRPYDWAAHHNRGLLRCRIGDHAGAAADYGEAARLLTAGREASTNDTLCGLEHAHAGNYDAAMAAFDRALRCAERSGVVFIDRCHARRMLGDAEGALDDADRALSQAPGNLHALRARSAACFDLLAMDDAVSDLDRAIAVAPSDPLTYSFRASARAFALDREGARRDVAEALHLGPSNATAHAVQASVAHFDGDLDGAMKSADRSRELDARAVLPRVIRADVFTQRGAWAEALAEVDSAARLEHNPGGVLFQRGVIHALAGDRVAALADRERSRALRPKDYYAPLWLAALGGDRLPLEQHTKGDAWRARLARFVLERGTEQDLLAFASSSSRPWERRIRVATVNAFAGIAAERAHDADKAIARYRAAVAENAVAWYPHTWSKARLAALEKK